MINITEIKDADKDYHRIFEQYLMEKLNKNFCFIVDFKEDFYSQGTLGYGKADTSTLDLPVYSNDRQGCTIFIGTETFISALYIQKWSEMPNTIFKNVFIFFSSFLKDIFNIVLDKPKLWMPLCIKGRGLIYQAKSQVTESKKTLLEFMIPMTKDAKEKNTALKHHVLPPTSLEDEGINMTYEEFSSTFQDYTKNYFDRD